MKKDKTAEKNELPARIATPRGYILSILFVIMWLVPMSYVDLVKTRVNLSLLSHIGISSQYTQKVETYINNLYRVACLFPQSVTFWRNYYYQVKLEGENEWITLDLKKYTGLSPFGYRPRIKVLTNFSFRSSGNWQANAGRRRRQDMAKFFKRKFEDMNPELVPVAAMRFIGVDYPVGGPIAKPEGHWKVPPP